MATDKTESGENRRLLEAFPPHTYAEWKAAAEQLLKGRPFEKTLVTPTHEGFSLQPIYTREMAGQLKHLGDLPGMGSMVRGSRPEGNLVHTWAISQELMTPTPEELNAIALRELESGQTELNFWLDKPTRRGLDADRGESSAVGMCGLSLSTVGDLEKLLRGIHPEMVSFYFQSGVAAPAVYALLLSYLDGKKVGSGQLKGCLGLDPIGWLVETGTFPGEKERVFAMAADLLRHAMEHAPQLQILDVQGHAYHNAGANSSQEMAAVLATGVAYLDAMTGMGVAIEDVIPRIRLSVSVGGNYFVEVAKLRALRLLWARVLEAFGVAEEDRKVHLHARTGLWNKTVFDPYVNMLRATTEAFSAVVGGCDSLHVGPFDEVFREPDAFSRRIARNTHHILAEECGLREVIDPAGGSWAVESLTDEMARAAWSLFQDIEGKGGILSVLESGELQGRVESVRQEKEKAIQQRRDVLVGTNVFPNSTEKPLPERKIDYKSRQEERLRELSILKERRDNDRLAAALNEIASMEGPQRISTLVTAAGEGATIGELVSSLACGEGQLVVQPLALQRGAESFENLRLAARKLAAEGRPARIHQLNIGPSRKYRMRADWTSSFFQVAGIEVLNTEDYDEVEDAVSALKKSGARVVVITSDDESYEDIAGPLASAIKQAAPATRILLAGAPGDNRESWMAAGIDDFVHVRVNNYEFNNGLIEFFGSGA